MVVIVICPVSASKIACGIVASHGKSSLLLDQSVFENEKGVSTSNTHGCVLSACPNSDVPLPWSDTRASTFAVLGATVGAGFAATAAGAGFAATAAGAGFASTRRADWR